jgi:hypothetical protein
VGQWQQVPFVCVCHPLLGGVIDTNVALDVAGSLSYFLEEDEVHLREQHSTFRLGAGQSLHRQSTGKAGTPTAPPPPAGLAAAEPASEAASIKQKQRRRWADDNDDARRGTDDPELIPAVRPDASNTGHMVRMRRGEAWGKFLAYEGCCQVCTAF